MSNVEDGHQDMLQSRLKRNAKLQDWLKNYALNTQRNYRIKFGVVMQMSGKTEQEIFSMRAAKLKQTTKDVMGQLVEEKRLHTAKDVMVAMVSFSEHFHIPITFAFSERVRVGKVKNDYVPKPHEVWAIAEASSARSKPVNWRNRAIIKTDWVTALRENAITSLRCGAVMGYSEEDCPIPLLVGNENMRIGEGNLWCTDDKISGYGLQYYYTFIAKEAFLDIQDWLAQRKSLIGPYDKIDQLFCQVKKTQGERMTIPRTMYLAYKGGATAIGLNPKTTTFHYLRDAFKSVMIRSYVDMEVREVLMGHVIPGSASNYFDNHDIEMVRREYVKADWSRTQEHKVDRIEKEKDELKAQSIVMQNSMLDMQRQMIDLQRAVYGNSAKKAKLEKFVMSDHS